MARRRVKSDIFTGDGIEIDLWIDPTSYSNLMRNLSQADKKVGIALHRLRAKVGGIIRDMGVALAPNRRGPQSLASYVYGPLSSKGRNKVLASLRLWGVTAPYYYRFVAKGKAGKKSSYAGARPYYESAERDTRDRRYRIMRARVLQVMADLFSEKPGLPGLRRVRGGQHLQPGHRRLQLHERPGPNLQTCLLYTSPSPRD